MPNQAAGPSPPPQVPTPHYRPAPSQKKSEQPSRRGETKLPTTTTKNEIGRIASAFEHDDLKAARTAE